MAATIVLGAVLSVATPARAELAILTDGEFLKVDHFELDGERMRLHLRGGGSLTLPLSRVERIVDDEVEPPVLASASLPVASAHAAVLELSFLTSHVAPATPYGDVLYRAAQRHNLNPGLLAALARAESAFDPRALSRKGARGILQLMPATAERFGVEASWLWDPEWNVEAGARYLRFLIDEFDGDLRLVLAAYNAGEGAVRRYRDVPPYRETRSYVQRVSGYLRVGATETAFAPTAQ
jgi:soluble lytic murein transglycosylase-like protein